jgi:peptide/nickel transport system substrate-binding protein
VAASCASRRLTPYTLTPHLTVSPPTHYTLSFVYSRLLRHRVDTDIPPAAFLLEPDVAERWEMPDDTTYVFHLRQGVRWHNKPPVNGRELVAADVKFTFDRFLTEPGNALRAMLEPVDRVEVVDRYTVQVRLKEPFVWLPHVLARP